ncbi:MAG: hypothetical protein AAB036_04805, partial [Elusimicrobiota bacterium]
MIPKSSVVSLRMREPRSARPLSGSLGFDPRLALAAAERGRPSARDIPPRDDPNASHVVFARLPEKRSTVSLESCLFRSG